MSETTVTTKGQTTIPKAIRDQLGLKAGDRLTFTLLPDGAVILRAKNRSLVSLGGSIQNESQIAVPIDQMSP
ncbi:MAG: AbrB/MazE/SpoVT family DNA-binding domain-containing protein [Candidatus Competibacteraceae bacterium]|nr:AbrB/MazE/SpoVT family DNA-binding domain-containing protein [Candidatus Competibacteraceae bacterium]